MSRTRSGAASCKFGVLLGVLLLLGALVSASTLPAAAQHQQARSSSFAPWREPQQHHINEAAASRRSRGANLQEHAASTSRQQQQQRVQRQNLQLLRGTPSSTIPSEGSLRSLQQSATSYQPPKFFISNVKAAVVNTYEWQITRQSTAGGVTLTANGQERQQMGYTLTYTKVLQKREFVIEGSADVTNLSGADKLTLMSLSVFVGSAATSPACRSMPKSTYTMQPVETLKCPFKLVSATPLGAAQLTGFVQTVRSRVTADPVPFSFEACGGGSSGSSSSSGITSFSSLGSTTAAPVGTAVTCTIQNVGECVEVTDGSFIQKKFRDAAGTAAAGDIPRSQLFAVGNNPSTPWGSSTQGPPRTEPVLPADSAAAAADSAASSSDLADIADADLPDASWWNHRRRQYSRRRGLLAAPTAAANTGVLAQAAAAAASKRSGRTLQQMPLSGSGGVGSQRGNQFKWPIPQVIGVRPPVGTDGKPSAAVPPKKICSSQPFQFSMIFGPLLPEACGIFEVHNTAAAAYTDNSKPPATHATYFYLTIHCPVADPAAAAAAASGSQRFRSVKDINPAVGGAGAVAANPVTQQAAPDGPAQLSFSNFRRNEAARLYVASLSSSSAVVRTRAAVRPESATSGSSSSSAARVYGPAVVSRGGNGRFYISTRQISRFRTNDTQPVPGEAVLEMGTVSATDYSMGSGNTAGSTTARGLASMPARASFAQAAADLPAAAPANATSSSNATAAGGQESAAAAQMQLPPSKLRVTILEVQPTLLSSYPWSLSSKPVAEQVGNVTLVGCQLIAAREQGVTGQLLIGTLRLGNPSRVTDADAAVIRVRSVTVTAQVQSEAGGQLEPVTAVAECKGFGADGTLELMPWRHTNCSFEIKISASQEGKSLRTPTGDLTATAVVEANSPTNSAATPAAAAGIDAATQDVSSPPFPYEFTADTPSGIRNLAIGSCADLSAGVIVAEELPLDAAAQAAAVAAAGANGTTADGRGGKCLRVCGLEFQAGTNVTVMTPLTGYAQQQCGTTQVYCMGAILPDNAGWQGQGKLSPAVVTTSSELTISGLQCAADIKAQLVNATAAETNSSLLAPPVGPPIQLLVTDVKAQRVRQYVWTSNLTLGSTPVTANGSAAGDTIQLPAGGAATLTLVAQHTKSALPASGKVTGQLQVQANPARGGSRSNPGSGLLKPELTPQIEYVRGVAVYFVKPCGGVIQGNLSGCDANSTQLKLPATCSFEFAGVNLTDAAAGVIVANATATVVIPPPPPPPPPGSPEPASPVPGGDAPPPAGDGGGTTPPDDGTGATGDDIAGDPEPGDEPATGDTGGAAAGDTPDPAGDTAGDAEPGDETATGDTPPEAGDTPPQQPASFAQAGVSFMQVTPTPAPAAPNGNVTDTAGDYKEPDVEADAAADGDTAAAPEPATDDGVPPDAAADGDTTASPEPATDYGDPADGADAPSPATDDAVTPPAEDGTADDTASPAPAGNTGDTGDDVTTPSDTAPAGSNSTAGDGTAPANGTGTNDTSNAPTSTTVLIAVQSVPVTVLLADAEDVEVDQCVNVTNSFKLTAAGVTPNTPAPDSGSNSTANLPQPVLLTTSELPPSEQLCFSSQITYSLQVGPVSSSGGSSGSK